MATEIYDVGDSIVIPGKFADEMGQPLDPAALQLEVTNPAGTASTYTYGSGAQIERDALGSFKHVLVGNMDGEWLFRWVTSGSTGDSITEGSFFVQAPLALVIRDVANDETANSWGTLTELNAIARARVDAGIWLGADHSQRMRAAIQAYKDIARLSWSNLRGRRQDRDYAFEALFDNTNTPPLGDPTFVRVVKEAQVAQAVYIIGGTQVRDMARDGIRMNRFLSGSEMEFVGYAGAVCVEAKEILARYLELYPSTRRI